MRQQTLWDNLLIKLTEGLNFLEDKPEETAESTLQALWFTAAGNPKSAQAAIALDRPPLDSTQENQLKELTQQRLDGVPLAHLSGRQQFLGIELLTTPEALIPRKETEILGHTAQKIISELLETQKNVTVMDICTGAGNLIVSLAALNHNITGYAADLSSEAVSLAKRNVAFHHLENRVEIRQGDLLAPFDSPEFHHNIDLLICNPPYISSAKVPEMAQEISNHEPKLAFDGGPFGIKILYSLIKEAPRFLKSGGWLAFEVGLGQGAAMSKKMKKNYLGVQQKLDSRGEIRVLIAHR